MQIIAALISALALASSTSALTVSDPVTRGEDIVYAPPITSPKAGAVWHAGTEKTIKWDTSSIPHNAKVYGQLLLGYLENGSENLDLAHPLATNFLLTNGEQRITVPHVPTKHSYIIVLYGDSGNRSPEFTIEAY